MFVGFILTVLKKCKIIKVQNSAQSINQETFYGYTSTLSKKYEMKMESNSKKQKYASFHKSMRWCEFFFFVPLVVCKYFMINQSLTVLLLLCLNSIYPVTGIMSRDPCRLKLKKFSVKFVLSSILLAFGIFETCCGIRWFMLNHFGIIKSTGVVFYFCSTSYLYLFHCTARKWHDYVLYWKTHERVFLSEPYLAPKIDLERLLTRIACFTLLIGFGKNFLKEFVRLVIFSMLI